MKFSHMNGDSTTNHLYVIDSVKAHERTKVFAGYLLARELRRRHRLQPADIRSATDEGKRLVKCHYAGVS